MTKEQALKIHDTIPTSDAVALRALVDALDAAGAFEREPRGFPNMTDAELLKQALASLGSAVHALQSISAHFRSEHLIGYAFDGIGSATGYLANARRRLDDPEAD